MRSPAPSPSCGRILCLVCACLISGGVARSEGLTVYDTALPLRSALAAETLQARAGWKIVAAPAEIIGDAVMENALVVVHARKSDGQAVLYSKLSGRIREGALVSAAGASETEGGDSLSSFSALAVEDLDPARASVLARGVTQSGKATTLRLGMTGDQPIVEFRPGEGLDAVRLQYRSGHALLPEIFGDDLLLRAPDFETSPSPLRLPANHACLHTLEQGDALLMVSWPPVSKEVSVHSLQVATEERSKAGSPGAPASFIRTDVPCTSAERVWVSLLSEKGIWHETDSSCFTFSDYSRLEWQPPFSARYRCDLQRDNPWKFTDSWMRQPRKDKFWSAFFSSGYPPLVIEGEEAILRIPRFRPGLLLPRNFPREVEFAGPILLYPFRAETGAEAERTPDGMWTVLDVLAATLGDAWLQALDIGEGILEVEPFPKGFVFLATCGATGIAEDLFSQGKEKEEEARIRKAFDDMMLFVSYHRARIDEYVVAADVWHKRLEGFLESSAALEADEKAEVEGAMDDLLPLVVYLGDLFEQSRETIKTPEHVKGLIEKAVALIGGQDPGKLQSMKDLGVGMRTIGGRQDDMLAAYRMAVKAFRQRMGQIHATARSASLRKELRELRAASQSILRVCSPYEEFLFLTAAWTVEKQ
jgi:hypothetical protein